MFSDIYSQYKGRMVELFFLFDILFREREKSGSIVMQVISQIEMNLPQLIYRGIRMWWRMRTRYIFYVTFAVFSLFFILTIPDGGGEWDTFHGDPQRTGSSDCDYIAGDILWSVDLENGYVATSPIMAGGYVYVVSSGDSGADSEVHCLDETTGETIWDVTIPGKTYQLSTPVFAKGRLYFGSSSGIFYCLIAETGEILWQRVLDSSFDGITSSPLFDEPNGDLLVGTGDGTLYNLELGTGATIWSFDTGAGIYLSSPTLSGDHILIGNDDGTLYAVEDGNEVWQFETGDQIRSSAAVGPDGTIYFASRDGMLRSLFPNGTLNWEEEIGPSISTPAIHNGNVFVGSASGLHAFLPNGNELFSVATQGPVDSSPAVSDHQILFTTNSNDGELIAADHNGAVLWSYPLNDHSISSPGTGDSTLYAASDSGWVWCFHSTEPTRLSLIADEISAIEEGERTIAFTGSARYDTGRPASGTDITITLLSQTVTGTTLSDGSFLINLTIDLAEGNHSASILVTDGTLENSTQVSVIVEKGIGDSTSSGDSDDLIPVFGLIDLLSIIVLTATFIYVKGMMGSKMN